MKDLFALIIVSILFTSCNSESQNSEENAEKSIEKTTDTQPIRHVEWSKNASIYEANIRQFTPEGSIKAFEEKLPEIKDLGIKIIWLMPVQPIGMDNRKGGLGSYYSIQDYTAVNPEFGSMDDLKSLVDKAHELDMKVILDWVANHTSWDHVWSVDHPEWYTKDSLGNFTPPVPDWSDVIDLNYDNHDMREAMIDAMKFWVTEVDMDGFRCDVAYDVPTDFWEDSRVELDKIKPMFMLAEADVAEHHKKAFDMSYGWELMHLMKHIVNNDSNLAAIDGFMHREQERFGSDGYRMYLLTSHDENSWNGTIEERYGDAEKAIAVLSFTIGGMPLIYSGQEYGNTKALAFFEKDNPKLSNPDIYNFYQTILQLKENNQALWNGNYGGKYERIATNKDDFIFALKREKEGNTVISIVNLSNVKQDFTLSFDGALTLTDVFSDEQVTVYENKALSLDPYSFLLMEK